MSRHFVAPGKVVVVGEYAVVDGAPALVAAIDIGVSCAWSPGPRLQAVTPTGDTRFVDAALAVVGAPPGSYVFRDHNAPVLDGTPGLGGSAAATVVGVWAARCLAGAPSDRQAAFDQAFSAHHSVQGSGSGIDVAASTWGGMLRFERGVCTPTEPISVVVVWSGRSASTGPRVRRYLAWADREAFAAESRAITESFHHDPVEAVRRSRAALSRMSAAAGIEWATPALDRIARIASDHHGAAKPSGAGGGDCAIALFGSTSDEAAFTAACRRENFTVLATRLAPGVREVVPTP